MALTWLLINWCCHAASWEAVPPSAIFVRKLDTALRNPKRGSGLKIFIQPAVMVTMSSQTHLAFKPDMKEHSTLDAEDVTLAASQMTGVPVSKIIFFLGMVHAPKNTLDRAFLN